MTNFLITVPFYVPVAICCPFVRHAACVCTNQLSSCRLPGYSPHGYIKPQSYPDKARSHNTYLPSIILLAFKHIYVVASFPGPNPRYQCCTCSYAEDQRARR